MVEYFLGTSTPVPETPNSDVEPFNGDDEAIDISHFIVGGPKTFNDTTGNFSFAFQKRCWSGVLVSIKYIGKDLFSEEVRICKLEPQASGPNFTKIIQTLGRIPKQTANSISLEHSGQMVGKVYLKGMNFTLCYGSDRNNLQPHSVSVRFKLSDDVNPVETST